MNTQLLIQFIALNAANVIIQTVKSLLTIKGSKMVAALTNAIAYGLYTIVVIYMTCELPLFWKVLIIGAVNFIGVYAVKWGEEKARKDKLWKIEATVLTIYADEVERTLGELSHSKIKIDERYTLFNFYCWTQTESRAVREGLSKYCAKFFASESKNI